MSPESRERRRVLVTGARGFIGRRCLPRLSALGFETHAVSSAPIDGGGATWHRCDLLDGAACEALVRRLRPTHLLHLAWIAHPGTFWASPLNLAWLTAGARLVGAFYEEGGERVVGAGSCAEYAVSTTPCQEDVTPIAPDTVYGEAKTAMHFALRAAARDRGSWAWMRLFFPYGPGEPRERFIPSVIDGLLRGEPVKCTHGNQVRDFIHADDVADACIALLDSTLSGPFNVGTGRGCSLREVAAVIVAELGRAELLRFGEREASARDRAYVVADVSKIRDQLGWKPRLGLKEGIRLAIEAKVHELKKKSA